MSMKRVSGRGNHRVPGAAGATAGQRLAVLLAAGAWLVPGVGRAGIERTGDMPFIWPKTVVPTLMAANIHDPVPARAAATATPKPAEPAPYVRATGNGAEVGVKAEFSTWSDLTALFRPSRWSSPMAQGGSLSWLNPGAWSAAPARTAKVLVGELVVAGAVVAISSAASDDDDDAPQAPATTATPTSTGASGGGSGSEGSTDETSNDDIDTPPPPPSGGGDENPFG